MTSATTSFISYFHLLLQPWRAITTFISNFHLLLQLFTATTFACYYSLHQLLSSANTTIACYYSLCLLLQPSSASFICFFHLSSIACYYSPACYYSTTTTKSYPLVRLTGSLVHASTVGSQATSARTVVQDKLRRDPHIHSSYL